MHALVVASCRVVFQVLVLCKVSSEHFSFYIFLHIKDLEYKSQLDYSSMKFCNLIGQTEVF